MKRFKNEGHDALRRRRSEAADELRKNERDEGLQKRRNSPQTDATDDEDENYFSAKLAQLVTEAKSPDEQVRYTAVRAVRKLLSSDRDPPIDPMITCGIVPILVACLNITTNPPLQFEGAWALMIMSSGTSENTQAVVDEGAVPLFLQLLTSPHQNVSKQALWALGNIIRDGTELREHVISCGVVAPLLNLIQKDTPITVLRSVTGIIGSICRGPPLAPQTVCDILQALTLLITSDADTKILADVLLALGFVADGGDEQIQMVIGSGVLPQLISMLSHREVMVQTAAVRAVGNIATGTDEQTQAVIDCDALTHLHILLNHGKDTICKEALRTLANVLAGTNAQVQAVVDASLIPPIIQCLEKGEFRIQREAAGAVSNLTISENIEQVAYLIDCGVIPPLCKLLNCHRPPVTQLLLECIQNILKVSSAEELQRVRNMIEDCGGLDSIAALQRHENVDIYQIAHDVIASYFPEDEADKALRTALIMERIFSFLGLADLKMCRLVSHQWNHHARPMFEKMATAVILSGNPIGSGRPDRSLTAFVDHAESSRLNYQSFQLTSSEGHSSSYSILALEEFHQIHRQFTKKLHFHSLRLFYPPERPLYSLNWILTSTLTDLTIKYPMYDQCHILISTDHLTSVRTLFLMNCRLEIVDNCRLGLENCKMIEVGLLRNGTHIQNQLVNDFLSMAKLKQLILVCGISGRATGLSINLTPKIILDTLHVDGVVVNNFQDATWSIKDQMTLWRVNYVQTTTIQFAKLAFGRGLLDLDALPRNLVRLSLILSEENRRMLRTAALTLPTLQVLEIIVELWQEEERLAFPQATQLPSTLEALRLFANCPRITHVKLGASNLIAPLNTEWIPRSVRRLYLVGNVQMTGPMLTLNKLAIQNASFEYLAETLNRVKSDHLVLDQRDMQVNQLDAIMSILGGRALSSVAMGRFRGSHSDFENSKLPQSSNESSGYYMFDPFGDPHRAMVITPEDFKKVLNS